HRLQIARAQRVCKEQVLRREQHKPRKTPLQGFFSYIYSFSPQTAVVRLKRSTDGLQLHPYSARSSKAHSDLSWHSHRDVRRTQRWMELSKSRPRSRSRKCRRGS
ncbi:AAEL001678-PA, partial [Aedes aegypti]